MMNLIDIPVTESEINFLATTLKSEETHSRKLEKETFLNYFVVPEEKKKQTEKEVLTAFKFVAGSEPDEKISMEKLK